MTEAKIVKRKPTIGKGPHNKLTKSGRIKHSYAYKRHGKHNAMKIHGPECFNLTRMWNEFLIKKHQNLLMIIGRTAPFESKAIDARCLSALKHSHPQTTRKD